MILHSNILMKSVGVSFLPHSSVCLGVRVWIRVNSKK